MLLYLLNRKNHKLQFYYKTTSLIIPLLEDISIQVKNN